VEKKTNILKKMVMQAEVVRACKAKFDEQLSRVYAKAVYQEYRSSRITVQYFLLSLIWIQERRMGGW
jgi:hypothetical protein